MLHIFLDIMLLLDICINTLTCSHVEFLYVHLYTCMASVYMYM